MSRHDHPYKLLNNNFMKKILIGFVGPKESGKSTAADYLIKVGFRPQNFKDELDHELSLKFFKLLAVLADRYKTSVSDLIYVKPLKPEIRELKKSFGTDVMRSIDKNYWVNKWLLWYKICGRLMVVADDVRNLGKVFREVMAEVNSQKAI